MRMFFIDESGYVPGDWRSEKNLAEQPFHVLAGVSFSADKLLALYEHIREKITDLKVDGVDGEQIGKGVEIKARDVARGNGYWKKHESERNAVRNIFLESVKAFEGVAFLSIVDKRALSEKYVTPKDPTFLSLKYIYERFGRFLEEIGEAGICVHDQNKTIEDKINELLAMFNAKGSLVTYHSQLLDAPTVKRQKITKILENTFAHSETSVGLQIADFYATQTYMYLKDGRPKKSGWWDVIHDSLKTDSSRKPDGYGYKEFP